MGTQHTQLIKQINNFQRKCGTQINWGRHGRYRLVVAFTTTYAISAYHN